MKFKTIITYTIADENLRNEFTDYLERNCQATKEEDQSTYVSPLDKEDVFSKLKVHTFAFGKDDHVNLYYCQDKSKTCQCLPLDKLNYK